MRQTPNLDRMNDLNEPLAKYLDEESADQTDWQPPTTPVQDPAPLTATTVDSPPLTLKQEALRLCCGGSSTSLRADLSWQWDVDEDNIKIKAFWLETLQSLDLRVFAYMQLVSAFIQLFHSAATFYTPGGDMDYHYRDRDIGFIGNRTELQTPTMVVLVPESPWKWVTRKVIMDEVALDLFYADPGKKRKL